MGFMESWNFPMHPLRRNPPKLGGPHIKRYVHLNTLRLVNENKISIFLLFSVKSVNLDSWTPEQVVVST